MFDVVVGVVRGRGVLICSFEVARVAYLVIIIELIS